MIDEVCKKLMQKNITVSVAESFTGGNVASAFVKRSGISQVFQASVIAYSNEAKIKLLGVKKDTIDTFDAVSKECATEMAQGARRLMNSDISISTTGFAGPSGGNDCILLRQYLRARIRISFRQRSCQGDFGRLQGYGAHYEA